MTELSQAPVVGRNLVICSDGTGQIWGGPRETNVVRLARWCAKDERQLLFYDPGVGTNQYFPATNLFERLLYGVETLAGLALGRGIYENVAQAYEFLAQNYREHDRIFLFGFSRGAFTVRSLSGLVRLFGIVRPDATLLIPLMLRAYFSPAEKHNQRHAFAKDIKANFTDRIGREANIHFIGVWDTVASVGGVLPAKISSNAEVMKKPFGHIRHAVSNGEYRAKFAPRLYIEKNFPAQEPVAEGSEPKPFWWEGKTRSFEQRWFSGAHSDVGGGASTERGLPYYALEWMAREAAQCGLRPAPDASFEHAQLTEVEKKESIHDQALLNPLWALTGLQRRLPPPRERCDPSLLPNVDDRAHAIGVAPFLLKNSWFLISLLASVLFCGLFVLASPGTSFAEHRASIHQLLSYQLQAPLFAASAHGSTPLLRSVFGDTLGWVLFADYLFIAAYTALLCTLCVYAVRGIHSWKPNSERAHGIMRVVLQAPLCALPLFDILENVLTLYFADSGSPWLAYPLAFASWAKFGSAALLFAGLLSAAVISLFAPRRQASRGVSGRAPAMAE